MITTPKMLGLLVVAFVAGSFVASPELRAYAAATIGSADIIDESIQSVDIKNGQVKAADIGADAVGGSELIGVTKLLFGQCVLTSSEYTAVMTPGFILGVQCTISGVDSDDSVIATLNKASDCIEIAKAAPGSGLVYVLLRNDCNYNSSVGAGGVNGGSIGIIVFDK